MIRAGNAQSYLITSTFSTLGDLDPPQVAKFRACISWIYEIINSEYPPDERYSMSSSAVALLGRGFDPPPFKELPPDDLAAGLRPLLDFLLLSKGYPHTGSPLDPEVIALQFVSIAAAYGYLDPKILPVLSETLLPTYPAQSRPLVLRLFEKPGLDWCSPQAEVDRERLLEVVGDPFQFIPDPLPQEQQSTPTTSYEPMRTAVLLIEFASSDLWRDYLRLSNFSSCEELISTNEGKALAFKCMAERRVDAGTGPFGSYAKLVSAIRHLEDLGCRNIAEVVTQWAWNNVDMNAGNHDACGLSGREALFYHHLRGIQRRRVLSRVNLRQPARIQAAGRKSCQASQIDASLDNVSRACQLKRLYQLFWDNPAKWEEVVETGEADDVLLGSDPGREIGTRTVISICFLNATCDYP